MGVRQRRHERQAAAAREASAPVDDGYGPGFTIGRGVKAKAPVAMRAKANVTTVKGASGGGTNWLLHIAPDGTPSWQKV